MKRVFVLVVVAMIATVSMAQSLSVVTGFPVPKKSAKPIVGAMVTITSVWDKDVQYMRKVDTEGFRIIVPQGSYNLEIAAKGYESYTMEIDIDQPNIDLDMIVMLTDEQATQRDEKRKSRAKKY